MKRLSIPGGWYVDALLSGEWVACRHADLMLDTWQGQMQPQDRLLFPTLTAVGGVLRIAGIAHGQSLTTKHISDRVIEWTAGEGWDVKPYKACGPLGVIYDANGLLRASDCGPGIGSDGFRCLDPDTGAIVTGQSTLYDERLDLFEWTPLGGGFVVGQGPSDNGAFLYDPATRLYHEVIKGKARFIKARRAGDAVVICCWVEPGHAEIVWATIDEIRANVPPVSTPRIIAPYETVVRINRPMWFGFFEFAPAADLPSNCRVPVVQGAPWLTVEGPGWHYVSGHPDGDVTAIVAAIINAPAPTLAYVPRKAQHALPFPSTIQGIEAYLGATESNAAFLDRISDALSKSPRAVLIAQCYTSNATLTTDLRRLPGLISRLARSHANVEGILVFSGSGRATGWQDHPEVHDAWREVFSGITGVPTVEAPPPPSNAPEIPESSPEPPPPVCQHASRILVNGVWSCFLCGAVVGPPIFTDEEPPVPTYSNALYPGEVLLPDDERRDPTGRTRLVFQGDRNLVLYRDGHAIWSAQLAAYRPTDVVMQTDGNLVAYDANRAPVWDTGTDGHPGAILIVRDEDVVVALDGRVLWSSADRMVQTTRPARPSRPSRPSGSGGGLIAWLAGLFRRESKPQAPLPNPDMPPAPVETPPVPTVPRPTDLRGQFVVFTRNPWYGDARYPRALPDRFFLAELDAVWLHQPEEAERILAEYKALGCNHVTVGTPLDRGYHGHYPDVDWLAEPDRYATFLRWLLAHGVEFSLFVLPDTPEYLDGTASVRWEAVEARLTPFYTRLVEQVEIRRVVSGWEWYTRGDDMVSVFAYLTRIFPNAERLWHNPVGHLSPCQGTEYQHGGMTSPEAWRAVAAAGCTGLALQAWPQNMTIPDTDRDHLSMLAYDISDMRRRFTGDNSPWGAAITTPDGTPLAVEYMEGCAYAQYWTDTARDIGPTWRRVALEAGARYALDGAPLTAPDPAPPAAPAPPAIVLPPLRHRSIEDVRALVESGRHAGLLEPRHPMPYIRAVLAEIDDPRWGLHLRPVGRHGEGVIAWNVPGDGQPYRIYDIVSGAMGDSPRPSWLDQTATMEPGSAFDPVVLDVVPPVLTLPRVRVEGTRFVTDRGPWSWVGKTSFDLPSRIRIHGDLRWADWLRDEGFTLARIVPASKYRTVRALADGVRDLPRALAELAVRGLYAEVVIGVDTRDYGMTRDDMRVYTRDILDICAEYSNTLAELGNENTHGVQADFMRDVLFLDELVSMCRARGITCSAGSTHGGEPLRWTMGDYLTHHPDRGRSPRSNADEMVAAQALAGKPVVDDEPLGTAEAAITGKRTADPAYAEAQGQATRALMLGGATYHSEAGLTANVDLLGPIQREAARRFIAAMKGL